MLFRFPSQARPRARLLPLLATVLYVLGTAADPLLHAHVGNEGHEHPAASLCPAEHAPEEGHAAAGCALCLLSPALASGSGSGGRAAAPRLSRVAPAPDAAPFGLLAHLSPAPRGPPRA